jgi:hypothetical protein
VGNHNKLSTGSLQQAGTLDGLQDCRFEHPSADEEAPRYTGVLHEAHNEAARRSRKVGQQLWSRGIGDLKAPERSSGEAGDGDLEYPRPTRVRPPLQLIPNGGEGSGEVPFDPIHMPKARGVAVGGVGEAQGRAVVRRKRRRRQANGDDARWDRLRVSGSSAHAAAPELLIPLPDGKAGAARCTVDHDKAVQHAIATLQPGQRHCVDNGDGGIQHRTEPFASGAQRKGLVELLLDEDPGSVRTRAQGHRTLWRGERGCAQPRRSAPGQYVEGRVRVEIDPMAKLPRAVVEATWGSTVEENLLELP